MSNSAQIMVNQAKGMALAALFIELIIIQPVALGGALRL